MSDHKCEQELGSLIETASGYTNVAAKQSALVGAPYVVGELMLRTQMRHLARFHCTCCKCVKTFNEYILKSS